MRDQQRQCRHNRARVVDSRWRKRDGVRVRVRMCLDCGFRWADQQRMRPHVRGERVIHIRVRRG